ncbi:MAG: DUF6614 family protein [Candidatus Thorarchaeota archaeon]
MDYYIIWCDLKNSARDLEFVQSVRTYLGHLQGKELIEGFKITRRKLGFGPNELGEFMLTLAVRNMAQLENTFELVATREGVVEEFHRAVYSAVTNFKAALYRDFPDPIRTLSEKKNSVSGEKDLRGNLEI